MTNTKFEQIRQFLEKLAEEAPKYRVLSSEEKPEGKFGEVLKELDTGDTYRWYEAQWNKVGDVKEPLIEELIYDQYKN